MSTERCDPKIIYADIFDLPYHGSGRRPRMSLEDRAAQFAPFAALTGYDDMVKDEARFTGSRIEPGEEALQKLNEALLIISGELEKGIHPRADITFFVPDLSKSGGSYETTCERIKGLDRSRRELILERTAGYAGSNVRISLEDVLKIVLPRPRDASSPTNDPYPPRQDDEKRTITNLPDHSEKICHE